MSLSCTVFAIARHLSKIVDLNLPHLYLASEAADGNKKWGSKSEQLTKIGGQTPHVDRVLGKVGVNWPPARRGSAAWQELKTTRMLRRHRGRSLPCPTAFCRLNVGPTYVHTHTCMRLRACIRGGIISYTKTTKIYCVLSIKFLIAL